MGSTKNGLSLIINEDLKAPQMHMQVIYFWYVLMRHELNKFKFIGVTVNNRIFVLIITYKAIWLTSDASQCFE